MTEATWLFLFPQRNGFKLQGLYGCVVPSSLFCRQEMGSARSVMVSARERVDWLEGGLMLLWKLLKSQYVPGWHTARISLKARARLFHRRSTFGLVVKLFCALGLFWQIPRLTARLLITPRSAWPERKLVRLAERRSGGKKNSRVVTAEQKKKNAAAGYLIRGQLFLLNRTTTTRETLFFHQHVFTKYSSLGEGKKKTCDSEKPTSCMCFPLSCQVRPE